MKEILIILSCFIFNVPKVDKEVFPIMTWYARYGKDWVPQFKDNYETEKVLIDALGVNVVTEPLQPFKTDDSKGWKDLLKETNIGFITAVCGEWVWYNYTFGLEEKYYDWHTGYDSLCLWDYLADKFIKEDVRKIQQENPNTFFAFRVADWDPYFMWGRRKYITAHGIQKLCQKAHLYGIKTWMWGLYSEEEVNNFLSIVKDMDMVCKGCYPFRKDNPNKDSTHQVGDTIGSQRPLDDYISAFKEGGRAIKKMGRKWIANLQNVIEFWKKKDHYDKRRPSYEELKASTYLAICYGADGLAYYMYSQVNPYWYNRENKEHIPDTTEFNGDLITIGTLDTYRRPYGPEGFLDSLGYQGFNDAHNYKYNTADSAYFNLMRVLADFNPIALCFAKIDWDTAFFFKEIPVGSWIKEIEGYKSREQTSELQYAEVGVFKDNHRDYLLIVNRHCLSSDTFLITAVIDSSKLSHKGKRGITPYVVYMKEFKSKPLYREGNFLKTSTRYLPGEGKLLAIVNDSTPPPNKPWGVWAIIILEHNGTKDTVFTPWDRPDWLDEIDKNDTVTYTVKIAVRGELFRHGPRARDVDSVVVELWDIEGAEPKLDTTWKREKVYENYVPESVEWADDECYLFTYIPSQINSKKFGHSYNAYIKVKAYNSFGRLIDERTFPFTPWWFIPGNTKHTCQRNDIDPDGKWYIAYTEEAEDTTVHLFTLGNNETLYPGKFPTLAVKGDTIGVAFLSKNSDTIYYTYKTDTGWSSPYPLVSSLSYSLSVPRTSVFNDTVYLSYQAKISEGCRGFENTSSNNMGVYLLKFPLLNPENAVVQEVSAWYEDVADNIDARGAGIEVDAFGNVYMVWREDSLLRFGVVYPSGETRICNVEPEIDLWESVCMASPGGGKHGFVPGILYVLNNNLVLSLFNTADTTEILRDTIYQGGDLRSAKMVGGGVVVDDGGNIKFLRWDAVENTAVDAGDLTSTCASSYPSIDAVSYVLGNEIHRDYYIIWTEEITGASFLPDSLMQDTVYIVATDILNYSSLDHSGILPYVYIRGGLSNPSLFARYRDTFMVYGDEIYERVDIGYDSLCYIVPSSSGKTRLFFEFYTPDTDYAVCEVSMELNSQHVDDFVIISGEPVRYELWISDSTAEDTLRITLKKTQGSYIPLSRLIVEAFERKESCVSSFKRFSAVKKDMEKLSFSFTVRNSLGFGDVLLSYTLPCRCRIKINVYDVCGRLIRTLKDGYSVPGEYTLKWNLKDENGIRVSQGVYFIIFEAGRYRSVEKIVIVK